MNGYTLTRLNMPRNDTQPLQLLQKLMQGYLDRDLEFHELLRLRTAISQYAAPVAEHENTVLVLGSYDDDDKRRLEIVKTAFRELHRRDGRQSAYSFLLSDIPGQEIWVNTEIKFRIFASLSDHLVGVPESDRGGFMFEQGILADSKKLADKAHFLKRDYPTTEQEHAKFSLMQADSILYDRLERRGDLYRWETEPELLGACFELYDERLS